MKKTNFKKASQKLFCKKILHEDIKLEIDEFKDIQEEFLEPTGRTNKNVAQIVQLQLGSSIMTNLEELLISLSRC